MQIKIGKEMSDLDSFLFRNNQQPTPRRSNISTQLPPKNQYEQLSKRQNCLKQNQPLIQNKGRSPARSASRKTITSQHDSQYQNHQQRPRASSKRSYKMPKPKYCQNHDTMEGNYHITIDNQDLFYCQRCANKLRNQGFPIKFQKNMSKKSGVSVSSMNSMLETYPHLEGHPQFQTLKVLLFQIYQIEEIYRGKQLKNVDVNQKFDEASRKFETLMDSIEQVIQFQRNQGRNILQRLREDFNIKRKNQQGQFQCSINQIQTMKNDIENNIESIVGEVDEQTFQQCVQSYKSRLSQLTSFSVNRSQAFQAIKQRYEGFNNQTYENIRLNVEKVLNDIENAHLSQVLCEEGSQFVPIDNAAYQNRGPFRNLFEPGANNSRKRSSVRK